MEGSYKFSIVSEKNHYSELVNKMSFPTNSTNPTNSSTNINDKITVHIYVTVYHTPIFDDEIFYLFVKLNDNQLKDIEINYCKIRYIGCLKSSMSLTYKLSLFDIAGCNRPNWVIGYGRRISIGNEKIISAYDEELIEDVPCIFKQITFSYALEQCESLNCLKETLRGIRIFNRR